MRETISERLCAPVTSRSAIWAAIFVAANVLLPQLFHSINLGGQQYLPIMLFTIVAAIAFGVRQGLAVALLSPVVSTLIFGMPSWEMCALLVIKGVAAASLFIFAKESAKRMMALLVASIAAYQVVGIVAASVLFNFDAALNMAIISWPAVIMQLVVGYLLITKIAKK